MARATKSWWLGSLMLNPTSSSQHDAAEVGRGAAPAAVAALRATGRSSLRQSYLSWEKQRNILYL